MAFCISDIVNQSGTGDAMSALRSSRGAVCQFLKHATIAKGAYQRKKTRMTSQNIMRVAAEAMENGLLAWTALVQTTRRGTAARGTVL